MAFFIDRWSLLLFSELERHRLTTICFYISSVLYGGFPFGSASDRVDRNFCQLGIGSQTPRDTGFTARQRTNVTYSTLFVHNEEDNYGT